MVNSETKGLFSLCFFYGLYRIIIAVTLFLILGFDYFKETSLDYINELTYGLYLYLICCVLQFVFFTFVDFKRDSQVLFFAVFDIVCFSIVTFYLGYTNIYVGLLFSLTIFLLNFIISEKKAAVITLFAVIITVYPSFISDWINLGVKESFLDCVILAIVFVAVFFISRYCVKKINNLNIINVKQSIDLKNLQNLNNLMLSEMDSAYLVLDEDFIILTLNDAAKNLLNVSERGGRLSDVNPDFYCSLKVKFDSGVVGIYDFYEKSIKAQVSLKILDNEGKFLLITIDDMEKINSRALQIKMASIGQLSASMAHEIRNPLAIIVQATALMRMNAAGFERYVSLIEKQSDRVNKIIESTLSMSIISTYDQENINLKSFFESLVNDDLINCEDQIFLDISADVNIVFVRDQLKQVFINLINNAIRHNNKEKSNKIIVQTVVQNGVVFIDVIDHGDGVLGDEVYNIFKPFYTTEINGTGVGLNLCKNICEGNRSKIEYVRISDKSHFRVTCKVSKNIGV